MAMIGARLRPFGYFVLAVAVALFDGTATNADPRVSTGTAYDSVLKLVTSADPPLRRTDFDVDFRAGLTPDASCMPGVVRRYMTPDRERIDDVCKRNATIVDCVSRTVTLLDLERKTFLRTSLDTVHDDGIAEMRAVSERVKSTSMLVVERSAHGIRLTDGVTTQEYTSIRTQSIVSPEVTVVREDRWTYDFLANALPRLTCLDHAAAWLSRYGQPQHYAPELQNYFATRFEKLAEPRSQIIDRGVPLPDWRIPLYAFGAKTQRQSGVPTWTTYFEVESGNIRTITSDDAIFRPPAEFTPRAQ